MADSPTSLYCESCSIVIGTAAQMTQHGRRVHRCVEMIVCEGCKGYYGSYEDLLQHGIASEEMYQKRLKRGVLGDVGDYYGASDDQGASGAGDASGARDAGPRREPTDDTQNGIFYQCNQPGCDKAYQLKSSLARHKRKRHT